MSFQISSSEFISFLCWFQFMRDVRKSQDPAQGKLPGDFMHDHSAKLQRQRALHAAHSA